MQTHDDFPVSSAGAADSQALYAAFLQARDFLEAVPTGAKSPDPERALHQLTSYLYARRKGDALFRANASASGALAEVWLSRVSTLADWYAASTELPAFTGLNIEDLTTLSKLSSRVDLLPTVPEVLRKWGVILIHEPSIPGAKLDGAVFLSASGRPVIGLSLRYARLDYYWFTLMHELAHVVLHYENLSATIVEDLDEDADTLIEMEANRLARDAFVPRNLWRNCPAKYSLSEDDVRAFARSLGIAPQIVAGRLRNETRRHELFAGLIHEHNVRGAFFGEHQS